jgi:hypothetical protein
MNPIGCAFDDSVPISRFQGAELVAFLVGSTALTLELSENRRIHLDYQGYREEWDTWLCKLPLCGDRSLMRLVSQTITVEFVTSDEARIHFSGGDTLVLLRDAPGADLVRFCIGEQQYPA